MENSRNFNNAITRIRSRPLPCFTDIFSREVGSSHPTSFARRFTASEATVKNLSLYGKLEGHEGCVNTTKFNSTGDLLVSGSDDRQVMCWNWASKTKLFAYPSGHSETIYQTKFMPFTDDSKIVTSAGDGEVRLGLLHEDGGVITTMLGKHEGSVFKLVVEPGSPHTLYSCGEDGFVQHFDLRTSSATKLFRCYSRISKKMYGPSIIELNSIAIDPRNPHYIAVGGSAEYARLYDIRRCQWRDLALKSDRPLETYFCPHHLIGSYRVHITGMAYSSSSELLISYSDDLIYLFERNAKLGSSPSSAKCHDDLDNVDAAWVYEGHKNTGAIKGVNFFGPNDEYVMSGSDCGHIFIWKKKNAKLVRLMADDVNQLASHPHMPILATCGLENYVKIWAPLGSDIPPLPTTQKVSFGYLS
ncbi:uncharacterized protein LOC130743841 [Lotus japonicus]|uniref:uncharacterized protein LOC130743841 n=1 Tax=Lotus japonicus TaxID=34305 RepID=UPI00258E47F0|nr:uncharacterized protein LOC130743841 [Lotus japonicus]